LRYPSGDNAGDFLYVASVVKLVAPLTMLLSCATVACQRPPVIEPSPRRAAPAAPSITDADGDGLDDARDRCPAIAEDRDGLDDDDGCPEADADHDRIVDEVDACPREPGGVLAEQRGCPFELTIQDGCPLVPLVPEIEFESNTTSLAEPAAELVSLIARDVADLPDDLVLIVAGHRATTEPPDAGLERARAVQAVLVEHGLAASRITLTNRRDRDAAEPPRPNRRVTFRLQPGCADSRPADYDFQRPVPARSLPSDAPAMRYANLSPGQCRAEIDRRKLPLVRDRRPTPGVATGVRFDEPVHGVTIVAPGKPTTYGVMDCRLALTLDDVTQILQEFAVVRIRVDNTYRRGANLPHRRGRRSQHAHGLAADITAFYLADGRELNVERDWSGERGEPVCGPDAELEEPTEKAILLRDIACELGRRGLFHTMLTPNYDAAHHNHFHFDIKRDAKRWNIH
jgi:hypothetical protein